MPRPRKQPRLCKHCAALAQRKIASHSSALVHVERLLYIPGQDCGNKCFETWITTQRIKVRIDLEERAIETVVIASRLFQPIQRLILFAKRQVNYGKSVCWHVARLGLFSEPGEYLLRFILLPKAHLGMSEQREDHGIVVYLKCL